MEKWKNSERVGLFITVLLLLQPLLDVFSFWMQQYGLTAISTLLRMGMLVVVSLYGFLLSRRKKSYAVCCGVIGGFWLMHVLSCLRTGYLNPLTDAAEYLKLVQLPLWMLAFWAFLEADPSLEEKLPGILTVAFCSIVAVIGISFLTGLPGYTYDYPERGIQIGLMGWFGVSNAQSAIVLALAPAVLLWGYRTGKLWLFSGCTLAAFGLLYATGTRLTYLGALLIGAGFLVLFLLDWRRAWKYCLPVAAAMILLVVFQGLSPMAVRQKLTADSDAAYRQKTEAIMGEDMDFVYRPGEVIPDEVYTKIRKVYTEVYGETGAYGVPLLKDLIDRFGVETVMAEYGYTVSSAKLYNARTWKNTYCQLIWQEQELSAKLFGFEYAESQNGENNYDPESDFAPLLYYYGYVGLVLYGIFLLLPVLALGKTLLKRGRKLLTPALGAVLMQIGLLLGAAQFSGNVLRRPNVTVYLSLALALLWWHCRPREELQPVAMVSSRARAQHKEEEPSQI